MALPSIFILLFASFLSVLYPFNRAEQLDHTGAIVEQLQMQLPEDIEATQLLLERQQLRDLAHELALDYFNEGDKDILSNIAKRDPGKDDTNNRADADYDDFVRRGVPPTMVKLSYGKRSNTKRFQNPFFFGKRVDGDKRGYSPFMFGKRDLDFPHLSDKRRGYSPLIFGKRDENGNLGEVERNDGLEEIKRAGYSALYFGKRVPEISNHYLSKRGHYSKFIFGKRDDGGLKANPDDMKENFEKKDANRRFEPEFYLRKRNYVAEKDDMEEMEDV